MSPAPPPNSLFRSEICSTRHATSIVYFITYPNATAEASASPKAADFPRPRAAVKVTVLRRVFSDMASTNLRTALALKDQKHIVSHHSYRSTCIQSVLRGI